MISTLQIIDEPPQAINKLGKFVPDLEIEKRLSYMNIPLVKEPEEEEAFSEESDSEKLHKEDTLVISGLNDEEITSISFEAFTESNSTFIHHEIYVFSVILDTAIVMRENLAPLIAVGSGEKDIFVFDTSLKFPLLPQALLTGHTDSVFSLKLAPNNILWSGSKDGSIAQWDLNELKGRTSILENTGTDYGTPIEKFDIEGSNLVYGSELFVSINNESITLDHGLENLKLNKGMAYICDEGGYLTLYDLRNLKEPYYRFKAHDGAIYDMAFSESTLYTTSQDSTIKSWTISEIKETGLYERESPVYVLSLDKRGRLFCGGSDDTISYLLPENEVKEVV